MVLRGGRAGRRVRCPHVRSGRLAECGKSWMMKWEMNKKSTMKKALMKMKMMVWMEVMGGGRD